MSYTYALTATTTILRSDGAGIPPDPANSDYVQYLLWVAAGNAPTPYTPPAPTPAQQAAAAIAAGITVTSASTPAINGTYACDPETIADINAEITFILVNGTFTGSGSTLTWPANPSPVVFPSVAVYKAWASAVASYVGALKAFANGTPGVALPPSTVTIS